MLSLPAVLGFNVLSGITPMSGYKYHGSGRFSRIGKYPPTRIITFCPVLYKKEWMGILKTLSLRQNGIGKPFPQYLRKYMSYVLPLIIVGNLFQGIL